MVKGKLKNLTNRNQDSSPSSELSTPTSTSPGYPKTPEKLDSDSKSYLMMLVDDFKKGITNSLKEIQEDIAKQVEGPKESQENTAKQVEVLKEKTQKSFKELQENTTKQVMELNKTIQNLKMEVETIKKTQRETTLEIKP
jgi:archaellum component FlaC